MTPEVNLSDTADVADFLFSCGGALGGGQMEDFIQEFAEVQRKAAKEEERWRIATALNAKRQPTPLPPGFKHFDVVLYRDVLAAVNNIEKGS